ncbi:MAG: hypothetical protein LBE22_01310 [Azoarcus sp.]|jgi:hypothetical protein|nr:hypothetical protein [Azoarcus sp.]
MMHKPLFILALLSVGCSHAVVAGESDALKLYPLSKKEMAMPDLDEGCSYQLKGTKNPEILHFGKGAICPPKGRSAGVSDCVPGSVINVNNKQMNIRRILKEGYLADYEPALYENDDYVIEIKSKFRDKEDCEKNSCEIFFLEAVMTIKKGSLQRNFEMHGSCYLPN